MSPTNNPSVSAGVEVKKSKKSKHEHTDSAEHKKSKKEKKEKKEKKRKEREETEAEAETETAPKKEEKKAKTSSTGVSTAAYYEKHAIVVEGDAKGEYPPFQAFSDAEFPSALKHFYAGFANPSPIQAACWPAMMAGRDVVGIAETGYVFFVLLLVEGVCARSTGLTPTLGTTDLERPWPLVCPS
jgi:ATP-dependent RNA helicase DBP3